MSIDPSVEPLSATTTSPQMPASLKAASALSMQRAIELASFRQGMTTETSMFWFNWLNLQILPLRSCCRPVESDQQPNRRYAQHGDHCRQQEIAAADRQRLRRDFRLALDMANQANAHPDEQKQHRIIRTA